MAEGREVAGEWIADGRALALDPELPGVVRTTLGRGGIRGLISLTGSCDLDAVGPLVTGVDRLLATDVSEIWLDLRHATMVAPIVVAGLVRARTRAGRFLVRVHLIAEGSGVHDALHRAGALDGFQLRRQLPPDLLAVTPRPAAPAPESVPAVFPGAAVLRTEPPATGISLLDIDPDLGVGLSTERAAVARRVLRAPVQHASKGAWSPTGPQGDGHGLLLLEGMLVRRVGGVRGAGAELLGPGDVLQVRHHPGEDASPWFQTTFRALSPLRMAVLDADLFRRLAAFPTVAAILMGRVMGRAHALTVSMAIAHYPRVDQRLLTVLWYLGQRWGRVTPRGIVLRLPLTHAVLADLTAARRPSITLAFQQLERHGELAREDSSVVLLGKPPRDDPFAVLLAG